MIARLITKLFALSPGLAILLLMLALRDFTQTFGEALWEICRLLKGAVSDVRYVDMTYFK